MHFDDDPDDVLPGPHITADLGDGEVDLGSATYDSDGDGIADSVIIGHGDEAVMITQTHDGGVVTHQLDRFGAETGPGLADLTGGTDEHDLIVEQGGESLAVGAPGIDMDGDGRDDTVLVHHDDGSITLYTDTDGDSRVDQLTEIDGEGRVAVHLADGAGGWALTATGHVAPDGSVILDGAGSSAAASSGVASAEAAGVASTDSARVASTDSAAAADSAGADGGDPGDDESASGLEPLVFTDADGVDHTLDAPAEDLDRDGLADTTMVRLGDGSLVYYSDLDGDGRVDQVIEVDPDGAATVALPTGAGGWAVAATGRVDPDGTYHPDAATIG